MRNEYPRRHCKRKGIAVVEEVDIKLLDQQILQKKISFILKKMKKKKNSCISEAVNMTDEKNITCL